MASHGNKSEEEAAISEAPNTPISTIVIIIGTQYYTLSVIYVCVCVCVLEYIFLFFVIWVLIVFCLCCFIHGDFGGGPAMQTEALPLVNRFQLTEDLDSV